MRIEHLIRVAESEANVRLKVKEFCTSRGYQEVLVSGSALLFRRGSKFKRFTSLDPSVWPAEFRVSFYSATNEITGLGLRWDIQTGLHLVGALDRAIFEVEARELEAYVTSGHFGTSRAALLALRRPVGRAAMTNMVLAILIVVFVGLLAGFPPLAVGLVALLIAVLDGVVVTAFADLILEGSRSYHESLLVSGPTSPTASIPKRDSSA